MAEPLAISPVGRSKCVPEPLERKESCLLGPMSPLASPDAGMSPPRPFAVSPQRPRRDRL